MKQEEIQERNEQIALMLVLKPLKSPYLGAYQPTSDTHNPSFYHERMEGESWYVYPDYDSDWNWLMEAVEFIEKLRFNTKACINCENDRVYLKTYPLTQTELSKEEEYFAKFISVTNSHFEFCFNIASSKKEAVFIAVSDFAKLHNNKEL
jgi:hypothetical protein